MAAPQPEVFVCDHLLSRKPHREDCLTIVGSRFRGPSMTLSDLADNIQAKTHAMRPFVGAAPLKRLKKSGQRFPIDRRPSVAYLDPNVSRLADHRDTDRAVRYAVMDCIHDEIPRHLPYPCPVPETPAVSPARRARCGVGRRSVQRGGGSRKRIARRS